MNSSTPFAGSSLPRDADRSSSPDRMSATGPDAVSPSGVGVLSIPPGYTDDSKICAYCGATYFRYGKCSAAQWARRVSCSAKKCMSIREAMRQRRQAGEPSGKPKDKGREAILFAGLSFTDDPRAVEREAYLRILPEPNQSLTGCAAQMTAASRVQ